MVWALPLIHDLGKERLLTMAVETKEMEFG